MAKMASAETASRRPAATRARIVAAAERLFASGSYDGVSMPEIAKAAGITAGAIYRHFDSKEALFFEVVRRAVEAAPEAPDAATGLPRMVASFTTPRLKLLRQLSVEMHHAAARSPRVRRLLRAAIPRNIADLSASIAAAQHAGTIDPSADPRALAQTILVFILGLTHMETLFPDLIGDPAFEANVEAAAAALLRVR